MSWVVWSVNTKNGAREGILPLIDGTWARCLGASGAGQAYFLVGDRDSFGRPLKYLAMEISRTLVFEWDGTPVYAGIIWDVDYDKDAGRVTISYADPWSILGRRLVAAQSSRGIEGTEFLLGPAALETLVKEAVEQATAGAMFELPIAYAADVAGTQSRTLYGYHLPQWQDVVEDLMNTSFGPDVDFLPRWRPDGRFEWFLAAGVPTPALLVWHLTARKSGVVGLHEKTDGNKVANHIVGTGEGTGEKLLTRSAIHGASPYPALVRTKSYSQVSNGDELQALVDAELELHKRPTKLWTFSVMAGIEHKVTEFRPGIGVRAYVQADPWMDDGFTNLRLIEFSGDLNPKIDLQFQPMVAT